MNNEITHRGLEYTPFFVVSCISEDISLYILIMNDDVWTPEGFFIIAEAIL